MSSLTTDSGNAARQVPSSARNLTMSFAKRFPAVAAAWDAIVDCGAQPSTRINQRSL